jgi:hypothetical protein
MQNYIIKKQEHLTKQGHTETLKRWKPVSWSCEWSQSVICSQLKDWEKSFIKRQIENMDVDIKTKCHSQVVNTPASYSLGPRFRSQPGNWLSTLRHLWLTSISPGKFWDSTSNWAMVASFLILSNSLFINQSYDAV